MRRSNVPFPLLVAAAAAIWILAVPGVAGASTLSSRILCPQTGPINCCPVPTTVAHVAPICCQTAPICCTTTCCTTTCCTSGTPCCTPTPCTSGSLTISASPNPSRAGRKVVITGGFVGNPVSGAQVVLWRESAGQTSFHQLASTTTDGTGAYTFALQGGTVMADQAWYVTSNGMQSATLHQLVEAVVGLSTSARSTTAGHALVLHGHVTPAHTGETVLIEQKRAGAWRVVARARLGRGSNYTISHRFTQRGSVVLRTVLPANARNSQSTSRTVTVTVKP